MKWALMTVVLGINLLFAHPVYPWKCKGHEIVGHIAQTSLTDKAWKKVKAILRPRSSEANALARAAIWPDEIGRQIRDMDSFHFVNFTTEESTYNRNRNCPLRNCVVEALRWYRRVMVDKEAPLNARRIALRFVVHLVGDIHQPLHAGHRKDRGGNTIHVNYKGEEVRLHRLWDTSLIEGEEQGSSAEIARRLDKSVTADDRKAWQGGTIAQWAEESLILARSHVYKIPKTGNITVEYISRVLPVIRQRLAQSGIRLAWVLNEAFK